MTAQEFRALNATTRTIMATIIQKLVIAC
jgi:hypothetical protein